MYPRAAAFARSRIAPQLLQTATPGLIFGQYGAVIPDLVFYTHERGEEIIANDRLIAAPDIVIEILSPGRENVSRDRIAKRQLYAKYGVKEYWIADSENRSVEIYRLTDKGLELAAMADVRPHQKRTPAAMTTVGSAQPRLNT